MGFTFTGGMTMGGGDNASGRFYSIQGIGAGGIAHSEFTF